MPTQTHKNAVVLLSGGLDSATTLAIARYAGFVCHALSFDYGQRHRYELIAAKRVAHSLGAVDHRITAIDLRAFGGSALTADIEVPKDRLQNPLPLGEGRVRAIACDSMQCAPDSSSTPSPPTPLPRGEGSKATESREPTADSSIPITYVPARNTIFLSFALALAETIEADDIFIGVNAVDYSGYPDCRPEYIKAFETMANLATRRGVEHHHLSIHAPLIDLTKADIIRKGVGLGVDYSLTLSCYDPINLDGGHFEPCGHCDSCLLRAEGFRAAGLDDPAIVEHK